MTLVSFDSKHFISWIANLLRTIIAGVVLGIGAIVYSASLDITSIKVTLAGLDTSIMSRNKTVDRRLDNLENYLFSKRAINNP